MPSMADEIGAGGGLSRIHFQDSPTPGSAAGLAIASGATLPAVPAVQRLKPAGDVTGILMSKGDRPQQITLINEANQTITFAAVGTSFVANGASCVISALASIILTYDPSTGLWYQVRSA